MRTWLWPNNGWPRPRPRQMATRMRRRDRDRAPARRPQGRHHLLHRALRWRRRWCVGAPLCAPATASCLAYARGKIKQVSDNLNAWTTCYDGLVASLNTALPSGKAIPVDIAKLMSSTEFDSARLRMDKAYAVLAADASAQAAGVSKAVEAWRAATELKVKEDTISTARIRKPPPASTPRKPPCSGRSGRGATGRFGSVACGARGKKFCNSFKVSNS